MVEGDPDPPGPDGACPVKPVIVCGSGPSLAKVDVYAMQDHGIPICAVSTAIRHLYKPPGRLDKSRHFFGGFPERAPDYWCLVDNVHAAHGPEGYMAAKDDRVKKVLPDNRKVMIDRFGGANTEFIRRKSCPPGKFMDDTSRCLIKRINRSMPFAIEWLCKLTEHDVLIFAGVDLRIDPEKPYVHDGRLKNKVGSKDQQHTREFNIVKEWYPIAQANGITWLCWCEGSPMNTYMEPFDGRAESVGRPPWPAGQLPAVQANE